MPSTDVGSQPLDQIPTWHRTGGLGSAFSLAGWWHLLISMPLLLILLLGWGWRLALWARLLWLIARLDLRLLAAHPDGAAGLGVVAYSLRAFSLVAMALGAIIAGRSAHLVLLEGTLPKTQIMFGAGLVIAIGGLFSAPLLVFFPVLTRVLQRGSFEYGAIADRVGAVFEKKWLNRNQPADEAALEKPDFSATTDLYSIVANVYALRLVPIDMKSVTMLAIALLLPFVPVVFLALPIEEILADLKNLLF
jgi:hypothetical protein